MLIPFHSSLSDKLFLSFYSNSLFLVLNTVSMQLLMDDHDLTASYDSTFSLGPFTIPFMFGHKLVITPLHS